jgi:hypothetical protein
MRKLIIVMLLVLRVSFAAFTGETVRAYDNKYQLKNIYDAAEKQIYDDGYNLQYTIPSDRVYDIR